MNEPLKRDDKRFSRLSEEARPVLPEGYTAPLDTRFARQVYIEGYFHERVRRGDRPMGFGNKWPK